MRRGLSEKAQWERVFWGCSVRLRIYIKPHWIPTPYAREAERDRATFLLLRSSRASEIAMEYYSGIWVFQVVVNGKRTEHRRSLRVVRGLSITDRVTGWNFLWRGYPWRVTWLAKEGKVLTCARQQYRCQVSRVGVFLMCSSKSRMASMVGVRITLSDSHTSCRPCEG